MLSWIFCILRCVYPSLESSHGISGSNPSFLHQVRLISAILHKLWALNPSVSSLDPAALLARSISRKSWNSVPPVIAVKSCFSSRSVIFSNLAIGVSRVRLEVSRKHNQRLEITLISLLSLCLPLRFFSSRRDCSLLHWSSCAAGYLFISLFTLLFFLSLT